MSSVSLRTSSSGPQTLGLGFVFNNLNPSESGEGGTSAPEPVGGLLGGFAPPPPASLGSLTVKTA